MINDDLLRNIEILEGSDIILKRQAVRELKILKNVMAVEALLSNINDKDISFQKEIIEALGHFRTSKIISPIIDKFYSSIDKEIKLLCLNTILMINIDSSVNDILLRANEIYDKELKLRVLQICSIIKPDIKLLNECIKFIDSSNDLFIKIEIIKIIGQKIRIAGSKNFLLQKLRDIQLCNYVVYALYDHEGDNSLKTIIYHINRISNKEIRKKIILALSEIGINGTKERLRSILNSKHIELRSATIEALGKLNDIGSEDVFIKNLSFNSKEVKIASMKALSYINSKKSFKYIFPFILDNDENIKQIAFNVSLLLSDNSNIGQIKDIINNNSETVKLFLVTFAIKNNISDNDMIKIFETYFKNSSDKVISSIIEYFSDLNYEQVYYDIIELIDSKSFKIRSAVINAITKYNKDDKIEILYEQYCKESDPKIRSILITKIGENYFDGIIKMMIDNLNESDPRVKSNIIETLEKYGTEKDEEKIVKAIFPFLNDNNNRVKGNAAKALWKFGGLRMLSILKNMLLTEEDKWQRASSAYILGEIGSIQVVKILVSAISDISEDVRRNVIKALGKTRDNSVIPILKERYSKETRSVRVAIIESFGLMESNELILWLAEKINYVDNDIQLSAIKALSNIPNSLSHIIKYIDHTNSKVKIEIIKLLSKKGTEEYIPILKERLKKETFEIRTYIKETIFNINKRQGVFN